VARGRIRKAVKKVLKRAVLKPAAGNAHHSAQHAVEQFLYHQADLLDRKEWER
jgi:hypothetical protein